MQEQEEKMKNWKKLAAAGLAMIVLLTAVVFAAGEKKDSEKTGSNLEIQMDAGSETKDEQTSVHYTTGATAVPAAETAAPELPGEAEEESPFIGTWVCGRATVEILLEKGEDEADPARKAAAEADKAAAGVTEDAAVESAKTPEAESAAAPAAKEESSVLAETGAPSAAAEPVNPVKTGVPASEEPAKTAETGAPAAEEPAKAGGTGASAAEENKESSGTAGTEVAAAAETPAEPETPAGDVYKVGIVWGSSYNEVCRWDYTCTLDKEGKVLSDPGTGIRTDIVFGAEGATETAEVIYSDGAAEFTINQEGKLLWNDKKEDAAQDMAFERVSFYSEAPSPEDLAEGFFRVIGSYGQGVSGTSLKEAIAACRAFGFAGTYDIMNVAEEELEQNLEAAWKSLKKQEQDAFSINYPGVISLVDSCLSNWKGARGLFEDAGVAKEMEMQLEDSQTRASWAELLAAFGKVNTGE